MTEPHDPFAHLHDEAYADPYEASRVGHAQLITVAGRSRISLDGDWHFTPDLFDEGLRQRWFADVPIPPAQWDRPRDHDPDAAETLAVPSCWTMARPEWRFFEGAGWYARGFDWDGSAERLFFARGGGELSGAGVPQRRISRRPSRRVHAVLRGTDGAPSQRSPTV